MSIAPGQALPKDRGHSRFYLPSLDGWRTIAILWVIVSHNPIVGFGGLSDAFVRGTADYGVQLFFAISGFLICSRLLREEQQDGGISMRGFYIRRLFRIQPAEWVYLLAVAFFALRGRAADAWSGIAGALLIVRNLGLFHSHGWDTGHFWSLAVEEHFYLLFPGFLVLCKRHRLAWMLGLIVALEFWRAAVFQHPSLLGFGTNIGRRTDTCISVILLGCVSAEALRRHQVGLFAQRYLRPWVAIVYTVAVFVWMMGIHHSRLDHILLASVFTLLVTATAIHAGAWTTRLLELAPLRYLGRISYSLYIWQQPFFNFDSPAAPNSLRSHVALCWCITFACAIASYHFIEKPLIRVGHRIARRYGSLAL
jgi:peptidoglycan/LPS O-acetylase OafA/YrhL